MSEYFMHKDKTYVGIMRLHKKISDDELKEKIKNFVGKIKQIPPVRSSVKRAVREREVKSFEILEVEGNDVLFESKVEAGTYIRKLIHDLGGKIGGAHMLELRRTRAGIFSEKDKKFLTLYEFESLLKENNLQSVLIPAEEAIKKVLPSVQLHKGELKRILTGKPLMKKDVAGSLPACDKFSAFLEERFIGVYRKSEEGDIIARAEFVFD